MIRLVANNPVFPTLQGEGVLSGQPSTFLRLAGCDLRCSRRSVPATMQTYSPTPVYSGWNCDTPDSLPDFDVRKGAFQVLPTRFATDEDVRAVVGMVEQHNPTHLVITGGEPTLQTKALIELLHGLRSWRALLGVPRPHVTVETNGRHHSAELSALVDLVSVSPKVYQAGSVDLDSYSAWCSSAQALQVKIVVSDLAVEAVRMAVDLFRQARDLRPDAVLYVQRADVLMSPDLRSQVSGAVTAMRDAEAVVQWVSNDPQLCEMGVRYGVQLHKVIGVL